MSSNIRIEKKCDYCQNRFVAKTTVTRYCSLICNQRDYKRRKRNDKIESVISLAKTRPVLDIKEIQAKQFLSIHEASILIGCSKRTVYNLIKKNVIYSKNLGDRLTRINRMEIDNL